MNLDDKMRKRAKERVIDSLRRHVPGKWRYEYPSRYIHESGLVIQAFSTCSISESGFETYSSEYRRSDTSYIVHPWSGIGLEDLKK